MVEVSGALLETFEAQTAKVGERYELLAPLGAGGMGRVYRTRDMVLDRIVALKLIDDQPDAGRETMREARSAARITHPSIARVFDWGVAGDRGYVVMELVEGQTLATLLRQRGALPPDEAVRLISRLADGLHAAHQQGVIHCDVKPQNIIVTPSGIPKLVDFGIARIVGQTRTLSPDEIVGSAHYVAPEQVRGERAAATVDVYALGVILYEALTGTPPFTGDTAAQIIAKKTLHPPPSPQTRDSTLSADLQQVVMTALAMDPRRRFGSAAALRDALERLSSGRPNPALATTTPLLTAPAGRPSSAGGPARAVFVRAAVLAAALLLAAVGLAERSTGSPSAAVEVSSATPTASTSAGPTAPQEPTAVRAEPEPERGLVTVAGTDRSEPGSPDNAKPNRPDTIKPSKPDNARSNGRAEPPGKARGHQN